MNNQADYVICNEIKSKSATTSLKLKKKMGEGPREGVVRVLPCYGVLKLDNTYG